MEAPSGTTSATSTNEAAAASPGAKKVAHLRADALKLPRGSRTALFVKPRTTRFKIVAGSLYWISKAKKQHNAKVPLDDILRVMDGQQTKQFATYAARLDPSDKTRSLSLVYSGRAAEEALDLVFPTDTECVRFKGVLEVEIGKARETFKDADAKYLRKLWEKADCNLDGVLSRTEVQRLINLLNINLDAHYISKAFKKIDADGSGTLDFEEFLAFMASLRRRPEIEWLWATLVGGTWETVLSPGWKTPRSTSTRNVMLGGGGEGNGIDTSSTPQRQELLPLTDFRKFLGQIQGETTAGSLSQAKALLQKIDPVNKGDALSFNRLSFNRFATYLNDDDNDVLDPAKTGKVYQDMSQPLTHYYIASSHNTYLEGDQLNSASSVNRYVQDLCSGCRCVELDCWDGEAGEPIVYHGHTLTGRILFEDIVKAVAEYAYVASVYPIILSLENHCGLEQQVKMAGYLKQHLGEDKIVMPPTESEESTGNPPIAIESPEALKGKFIIKAKRLVVDSTPVGEGEGVALTTPLTAGVGGEEEDDDEDSDGGEEDFDEHGPPHPTPNPSLIVATTASITNGDGNASTPTTATSVSDAPGPVLVVKSSSGTTSLLRRLSSSLLGNSSSNGRNATAGKPKAKKAKKIKVAPELSALAWMPGVHFHGWEGAQDPRGCTSYAETKMEKYVSKFAREWGELNKRMFTRTYPAGLRIDSSNYNPVMPWTVGCHIVALNYQTPGLPMQLNRGKFQENNNCGYLLKPAALRLPGQTFHPVEGPFEAPMTLTLTVISAQQLPKPSGNAKGEVIDPYVVVQVCGVPADQRTETTHVVEDDGFHPCWDSTFTFPIQAPEHALISLTVWDKDVGKVDDFIATAVLPVSCLRPGFRKVRLGNVSGSKGADHEFCSLFVFVHMDA